MNSYPDEIQESDIAIIAMCGRFPGAKNIDAFWENLRLGVETISWLSDQELLMNGVQPELLQNPNYVRASAVLDDIELFDANFFGFNPKEAEILDPQQRIFLECAWETVEQAGYNPQTYTGSIGVYAGLIESRYLLKNLYPNQELNQSVSTYQLSLANEKDFLPIRVAYKLNLTGPAVNIQTACSTSLVAVHMGCQSLVNGECDMALAGGVAISVPQKMGYLYQEGMISSPDGHCRAFDAKAQGTFRGNGVGIVMLKRAKDAIADRDYIYAIIKGSAINNDGMNKIGFTAPSVEGQAAVIAEAQAIAGIDVETITYVETHGTGTDLGDPIEIAALTQAFHQNSKRKGYCAIGSLKTNMGHLHEIINLCAPYSLRPRQLHGSLFLSFEEMQWGLRSLSPLKRPVVCLCPYGVSSSLPESPWYLDKWLLLVKTLKEQVSFLQIGHNDFEQKPIPVFTPKTTIRQMMALIWASDVYIGFDTGPSHIATALGKPSVVLWDAVRKVFLEEDKQAGFSIAHMERWAYPQNRNLVVQ